MVSFRRLFNGTPNSAMIGKLPRQYRRFFKHFMNTQMFVTYMEKFMTVLAEKERTAEALLNKLEEIIRTHSEHTVQGKSSTVSPMGQVFSRMGSSL